MTDEGNITVRANQEEGIRCEAVVVPAVLVRTRKFVVSRRHNGGEQHLIPGSKVLDSCCIFIVGCSLGSEFQEGEVGTAE